MPESKHTHESTSNETSTDLAIGKGGAPERSTAATKPNSFSAHFDRFSTAVTKVTGRPYTFIGAFLIVLIWAASGPLFNFSETWQLVINTGTTIITFLMVFVIQQSQNKDTMALHLKLNELIASSKNASNRLVNVEGLTEEELSTLKEYYIRISDLAGKDKDLFATHSIDEAKNNHSLKTRQKHRLDTGENANGSEKTDAQR